jgi:hypothetical protein
MVIGNGRPEKMISILGFGTPAIGVAVQETYVGGFGRVEKRNRTSVD